MKRTTQHVRREGYVILAVLIAIVVLSLVAYRFTDSMTAEYRASTRTRDAMQVKMAAVSGLHYAAAMLSDRDTFASTLGGNPYDNAGVFQAVQVPAVDGSQGKNAYFAVWTIVMADSGNYEQRFGVVDEGSKLNINSLISLDPTGQLLHDALMQLESLGMTEDLADAIVDWVDADDDVRGSGAESSYYTGLANPYQAKNGPLNSLDELLLVKGMTPYLLYGGDLNRNGAQDAGEQDETRGFADYLTIYGRELNMDSTGVVRIYLNGSDLTGLYSQLQSAVGNDLAAFILAVKLFGSTNSSGSGGGTTGNNSTATAGTGGTGMTGAAAATGATGMAGTNNTGGNTGGTNSGGSTTQNSMTATTAQVAQAVEAQLANSSTGGQRIQSLMDLIGAQVTLPKAADAAADAPTYVANSPLTASNLSSLLPSLMDKTTVQQAIEMVPRINVNTALREVLMGVPNMTDTLADQIIANRTGQDVADPATTSAAWLVTTNTLTSAQYKQMEKYLTGSAMVYRVQTTGYLDSGGPTSRMEAVIDTNQGSPRFLYIRDLADIENPPGFQPPTTTNQ